jgi:hypothetical protein
MSETTTSNDPVTGPIDATPPPPAGPPYVAPPPPEYRRRPSRLNVVAAWVGIVAGVVFIVSIIFGTGFILGAHSSGGHHRGDFGDRSGRMEIHQGPPMGPMFRPGPGFIFPGGPGGFPGGPGGFPGGQGGSDSPGQPPTTTVPR